MNSPQKTLSLSFLYRFRAVIRHHPRLIALLFIILLISTIYLSFTETTNLEGQNSDNFLSQNYNLTATPVEIYTPYGTGSTSVVQLYGTVSGLIPKDISVKAVSGQVTFEPYYNVTYNANYVRLYINLNQSLLSLGTFRLSVFLNSTADVSFQIHVHNTDKPMILELLGSATLILFVLGLMSWNLSHRKLIIIVAPIFLVMAALFGQRYDTFFLISTGIRLIDGVNPFTASPSFPSSLKWEYLPLYLPYSLMAYYVAMATGLPAVSNLSLNFPGTVSGFTFMAWRSLAGPYLLPYYLIIKLPLIVATIGTWHLLGRESPQSRESSTKMWLLNPYVILVGIVWGQLDAIATFFMIFSLVELKRGKTSMAAIMCSIGTGMKMFPAFLLPAILRESGNRARDLLLFAAALLPNLLLYSLAGTPLSDIGELFYSRSVPTFYGIFSSNGMSWQYILQLSGVESFPSLFLAVFVPFYIAFTVFYLSRKEGRDYYQYSTVVLIAFFLTYNYVNPQYFLWIVPILISMGKIRESVIFSVLPLVYMFLTYEITYFINPYLSYNYLSSPLGQFEMLRLSHIAPLIVPFILMVNALLVVFFLKDFLEITRRFHRRLRV